MVFHKMSVEPPPGIVLTQAVKDDDDIHDVECEEPTLAERRHKWINRQITCAAETGRMAWVLQVVESNLEGMNLINFSTALHRIAKLALACSAQAREKIMEQDGMKALRKAMVQYVDMSMSNSVGAVLDKKNKNRGGNGFCPIVALGDQDDPSERLSEMRCLSIICWSCATLRIREEILFDRVAAVSSARLAEMKPFELSNMLWAFAKLSLGNHSFFEGLAPHLLKRREGQFGPQCLSTIVWAFGTARVQQAAVFTSFARELAVNANMMAPQGIANTAWAFARVRRQEALLFRALAEAAVKDSVMWTFKPQELSNTVWAFATVGLPHVALFDKIMEVAISRRMELPPQNVANMLWAYAKLGSPARSKLFPPLLEVTVNRLELHKPQEVSAILWAVAREVQSSPICRRFILAVPHYFNDRLAEFTSQALACMVEAFTLAEVDSLDFFANMMQECISRLQSFQPPSLCTLFRGIVLKTQRHTDSHLDQTQLQKVSEHIVERLCEMQPHNMLHLAQTLEMLSPSLRASRAGNLANCPSISAFSEKLDGNGIAASTLLALERSDLMDPSEAFCLLHDSENNGNTTHGGFSAVAASIKGKGAGVEAPRANRRRTQRRQGPERVDGVVRKVPKEHQGGNVGAFQEVDSEPRSIMLDCAYEPHNSHAAKAACNSSQSSYSCDELGRCGAIGEAGPYLSKGLTIGEHRRAVAGTPEPLKSWAPPPMLALARTIVDVGIKTPQKFASSAAEAYMHQVQCAPPAVPDTRLSQAGYPSHIYTFQHPPSVPIFAQAHAGAPRHIESVAKAIWMHDDQQMFRTQQPQVPHVTVDGADCTHTRQGPKQDEAMQLLLGVDPSYLAVSKDNGSTWTSLHLDDILTATTCGTLDTTVILQSPSGSVQRVVIKFLQTDAAHICWLAFAVGIAPQILRPIVRINTQTSGTGSYFAYPHCCHGSVAEWISRRWNIGQLPTLAESARIAVGTLLAGQLFLSKGVGIDSVRSHEIFLDEGLVAHIRLGHKDECMAKWLSPEEARSHDSLDANTDDRRASIMGPQLVFRVGLLLYCLGSGVCDPHYGETTEAVLLSLQCESLGFGSPLRPDMTLCQHPSVLKSLINACLDSEPTNRPSLGDVLAFLSQFTTFIAQPL